MKSLGNKYGLLKAALLLAAIASSLYLLMLGWFNHLQLDDYGFVVDAENMGVFGMAKHMYMTWECRFSAFVVQNILNITIGRMSNLIFLTILQLVFAYGSIYLLFKYVFRINDKFLIWNIAIITANIAIMSYFELSTFYWLSAAWYNLPIFTTICLIVFLFFSTAKLHWRWLGAMVCSLYLSGCPENYVPIVIVGIGAYFIYSLWQKKTFKFWNDQSLLMTFITLVVLFVGLLSMVFGPGNKVRLATMGVSDSGLLQHIFMSEYLIKSIKAFLIFSMRLVSRCLYYLLLIPLFMYIGFLLKQKAILPNWFRWKSIMHITLILICLLILTIIVSVYGIGWYAPLRSYCFVSFMMAFYFAAIGICLGGLVKWEKINMYGFVVANLVILSMSVCFISNEYPIVKEYHNQISMLQQKIVTCAENNQTMPLFVEKITLQTTPNTYAKMRLFINKCLHRGSANISEPNTYSPYMQINLSTNPSYFVNRDMQEYYGANCDIIGWSEE